MAKIPVNMNSTEFKLNNTFFEIQEFTYTPDDFDRDYCGMSGIGNKCLRALQYTSRLVSTKEITPRTQNIFNAGHVFEEMIVKNLEFIGIKISDSQKEIVGFAGHWKGHIDGVANNVPEAPKTGHLLEIKTHNDKSFKLLKKSGVIETKPVHYSQMTRYMKGLNLKRALYIAYNKNDSTYYAERVEYSPEIGDDLVHKEQEVLLSERLFPRIGNNKPSWYECKWCGHNEVCFENKLPKVLFNS